MSKRPKTTNVYRFCKSCQLTTVHTAYLNEEKEPYRYRCEAVKHGVYCGKKTKRGSVK